MTKEKNSSSLLILLCWLAYTCSYIGKLSYSANITEIEAAYGVTHAQTGIISTFFFFVYGAGQIVNGLCCKRYNIKHVVFGSLLVASGANLLLVLTPDFALMKYIWLVNGAAMSFLWTALIRLLSETLAKKDINRAIVVMGTTVATGTFLVYGLSAVFAALDLFRITFYIAAAIMTTVAIIWLCSYNKLVDPLRAERKTEEQTTAASPAADNTSAVQNRTAMLIFIGILAIFAVANNFVKDGLTTWTPSILRETYNTPAWLSILLTLLLPMLAIGGAVVAVRLHARTRNFVSSCTILFTVSALLVGVVMGFLSTSAIVVTICCFALVSCLMAGVNNVITSMVPLHMKGKMNSGMMAGILNGFCYLGSTLSSYGLGSVADASGWSAVFLVLLAVACFVALLGVCYLLIGHRHAKG